MFQPEPSLIVQPDGAFTLLVKALVPNSCYVSGTLKPGIPPGTVIIPEARPFIFEIVHHKGLCAQFVHHISASIPDIKPDSGHNSIIVFSVLEGRVVGSANLSFPPAIGATAGVSPGSIIPDTVSATVFSGIVGPATLRVTALVATPTPGYTATLAPAQPQGINPRILLLRLTLRPPAGPVIQIPSTTLATYEITPYSGHYSDVSIINGTQVVTVPVIVIFSAFDPVKKHEFSTRVGNG
jgi:hypothetical protein